MCKKHMRRVLAVFVLLCCLRFTAVLPQAVDADIRTRMESVYDRALSLYRKNTGSGSFYGNCGVYISYTLNALGIDDYLGGYNGNAWFNAYQDGEQVGAYRAVKVAGANCLQTLAKTYGTLSNIIVSYTHQTGYTDSAPGAGHVVFITHLEDNTVYFTESYAMYGVAEGDAHVMSLDSFCSIYNGWYGDAIGAIWLSDGTAKPVVSSTKPVDLSANTSVLPTEPPAPSDGRFAPSFPFRVDTDKHLIYAVPVGTHAAAVRDKLTETSVIFLTENGQPFDTDNPLSTGSSLFFPNSGGAYTLCVTADVDGDGRVTSTDARSVLREVAQLNDRPFSTYAQIAADVDGNGLITSADARMILRGAAGLVR